MKDWPRRLKATYLGLPAALRGALEPARFLFALSRPHRLVLLEGPERSAGKPLRLVCTDTAGLKEYLLRRCFASGARQRPLGTVPAWMSGEDVRTLAPESDLLVWYVRPALERLPRPGVLARLPAWIMMHIDLRSPECLAAGKEKFTRSGNAIKKKGWSLSVTRDLDAAAVFYRSQFLPYVRSRHGESATIQTLEETMEGFRGGRWELLSVERGGERLAGATVEFDAKTARFWQIGVRDGDPALLSEGISDAVYHHMLAACRARGCEILHLGACRPFAQDGVLEYKRRFGAYVAAPDEERRGSFDLTLLRLSPAAADFLAANPMIAKDASQARHLYAFSRGGGEEAAALARTCRERYGFMRTLDVRVFSLEDGALLDRGSTGA